MNEKLYPRVLFICIMLISLILAFAGYIDDNVPIVQQECQASYFLAPLSDYYAKAIVLLNEDDNNAPEGVKHNKGFVCS